MSFRGVSLTLASLAVCAVAFGEEEQKPQVQVQVAGPGFVAIQAAAAAEPAKDGEKGQLERAAMAADLVAVVKVTAIAEPKDEADPAKGPVPNAALMVRRWQAVEKTVSAEVVELLKGDKEAKSLQIVAQVRKTGNQEQLMVTVERRMNNGASFRTTQMVPFTLAKDKESLVFLKLLREEKDEAGKVTGKVWSLVPPVPDGAPKESQEAVRAALRKLADWEKAPELSAEEAAALDALVKQLGSDSFETREKATKALTEKGEVARGKLREAGKSADAETRERAARVLEAITPEYLKAQPATDPSTGVQIFQGGGGAGVQIIQMEVQAGN